MNKHILILGSDGMVGRTVFTHLNSTFSNHVWGTTRKKKNLNKQIRYFSLDSYQKDFTKIQKNIGGIQYIINCIGIKDNSQPIKDFIIANALFPHLLEKLAEENNCKLIHISTDAVFSQTSGKVSESSPASPYSQYGMTKLLGETSSKNALTIRSSFIGYGQGLLAKMKRSKEESTNHHWSGCTTVQFAKLCELIIKNNSFTTLRKHSPLFHFSPLFDITRYELAKTFMDLIESTKEIKKIKTKPITRLLVTDYPDALFLGEQKQTLKEALQELML